MVIWKTHFDSRDSGCSRALGPPESHESPRVGSGHRCFTKTGGELGGELVISKDLTYGSLLP